MKRFSMLLAAGLLLSAVFFAGCTPAQLQNTQTIAQKFQNDVTLACNVIQPAIEPLAPFFAANAAATAFNTDVTLACGGNAVLNLTSVTNVIKSSAAAAQAVVAQIPGLTATQIGLIQGLIGAFKGSLQNALTAYQASTDTVLTTGPATALVGASASPAASTPTGPATTSVGASASPAASTPTGPATTPVGVSAPPAASTPLAGAPLE